MIPGRKILKSLKRCQWLQKALILVTPVSVNCDSGQHYAKCLKVKRMQRSGTEAIRTQIQPSKREITKIANSSNTERTYGQPSEQLFSKRWPLSNPNRTKNNMNTRKVKRHRNSDTKTGNREPQKTTALERTVMNYWGWGGGGLNHFYVHNLTLSF